MVTARHDRLIGSRTTRFSRRWPAPFSSEGRLVLLQAHQLATSLYTFGHGYETVPYSILGFDTDVVKCGNRPPGKDQSRFYKSRLPPYVLSCSRAERFVVAGNPTYTQHSPVSRINPQYLEQKC